MAADASPDAETMAGTQSPGRRLQGLKGSFTSNSEKEVKYELSELQRYSQSPFGNKHKSSNLSKV